MKNLLPRVSHLNVVPSRHDHHDRQALWLALIMVILAALIATPWANAAPASTTSVSSPIASVRLEGYHSAHQAAPRYPEAAIINRIEGYVAVQYDITGKGSVANPRILEAKPAHWFDQTALEAVRQFSFDPYTLNGHGIPIRGVVSKFVFQLKTQQILAIDTDSELAEVEGSTSIPLHAEATSPFKS